VAERTASDLAFIRTEAHIFAWSVLAADELTALGIDLPLTELTKAAKRVLAEARLDPKFVGNSIAIKKLDARI
jgi:hypothetical protein